jgi:hypothetical protein
MRRGISLMCGPSSEITSQGKLLFAVEIFTFYCLVVSDSYQEGVATVVGVPPTTIFGVGLIKCVVAIKGSHP